MPIGGIKHRNKVIQPYFSVIILSLLSLPFAGIFLAQEANGQLHLPTLEELEQSANAGLNLPTLDELQQSADAGLNLPTLDEIEQSEYPQAGSADGWEDIINQGPSQSSDGWEDIINQGPPGSSDEDQSSGSSDEDQSSGSSDEDQSSGSSDGWEEIINQGPPENDFTSSVIEAMESGAIDPGTAAMLGNADYCGTQNVISNLQEPVIEGGMEITHTDPACPGMEFNGR